MMENLYPHQPEGRRWDAFLTAHVLHLERIDGGGAETLGECRSRALSNIYFSVIKLSFHCFLLNDVISAATSSICWQTDTEMAFNFDFFFDFFFFFTLMRFSCAWD